VPLVRTLAVKPMCADLDFLGGFGEFKRCDFSPHQSYRRSALTGSKWL